MTTTDTARAVELTRAYPIGALEVDGDGRTIYGRCVPYDVETPVVDRDGGQYVEVCRPGMFRRALKAAHRCLLNWEHRETLTDQIGHAVELREDPDGLYGTFRALETPAGDQALALIRAGAATGLSVLMTIEANGSRHRPDGVVERRLARLLNHVALTTAPQYEAAGVLGLRSADPAAGDLEARAADEVRAWAEGARLRFRSTA